MSTRGNFQVIFMCIYVTLEARHKNILRNLCISIHKFVLAPQILMSLALLSLCRVLLSPYLGVNLFLCTEYLSLCLEVNLFLYMGYVPSYLRVNIFLCIFLCTGEYLLPYLWDNILLCTEYLPPYLGLAFVQAMECFSLCGILSISARGAGARQFP